MILQAYWEKVGVDLCKDTARKNNVLAVWGTLLKRGGSCGVCGQAMDSLASSALQRSPPFALQGSLLSAVQRYNTYA